MYRRMTLCQNVFALALFFELLRSTKLGIDISAFNTCFLVTPSIKSALVILVKIVTPVKQPRYVGSFHFDTRKVDFSDTDMDMFFPSF